VTLPGDWTRCHDESCEHREECLRWIDRDSGWSHAKSLRVDGGPCIAQVLRIVTDLFPG
jgi:hypothetical protein